MRRLRWRETWPAWFWARVYFWLDVETWALPIRISVWTEDWDGWTRKSCEVQFGPFGCIIRLRRSPEEIAAFLESK